MTITALNEILVNLANSDFRVNQAYTGDVYDINTKENRFGCFVATPMTATRTDGGVITYHYVMYFIDRLTDDEANMDLVQTDAVNVLKRVIDNLGYNGIEMGDGYQFTLFKHQFDDWCAGAFVDIDFNVPDMDCVGFHIIPEDVDLRPVTITSNGKYVPEGFDGFSSVMVNVEGGSDVTKEWVDEEIDRKTQGFATKEELAGKADKSEIPSLDGYATESWVEGKGYLTEVPSDYAKKTDIPTIPENVSAFNNDAGYLTQHQDISGKVDKSSIWTGTQAQWDALTAAQKASYTIALITE